MTTLGKQRSAYGTWKSPISAEMVAAAGVKLSSVLLDDGAVYWLEGRPAEGGRQVIVRQTFDKITEDVLPHGFNARTLAHEYGGGAYTVSKGIVVFSNLPDQRVYKMENGSEPVPITESGPYHYADFVIDHDRGLVICIQEDHSQPGLPFNSIVTIPLNPQGKLGFGELAVCGCDFFSNPRVSKDGRLLCWLSWNHPNMPWDGTELWIGHLDKNGMISEPRKIAGGPKESIFQPEWISASALCYASDQTGFWNIYLNDLYADHPICVTPRTNDFAFAQWVFGMSSYAVVSESQLVSTYCEKGLWRLAIVEIDWENERAKVDDITGQIHINCDHGDAGAKTNLVPNYTEFTYMTAANGLAAMLVGGPSSPTSVAVLSCSSKELKIVKAAAAAHFSQEDISSPTAIEFESQTGGTAYAFYYAPVNSEFEGLDSELPPLLVKSHGGPTSAASSAFNLAIQFWTSRGFAVVDVNYGGSSGFGRSFRQKLNGNWGVVDVKDCESAAKYLVDSGKADRNRLTITGGSAGGYTTLCALTFGKTFKAGASHYGVSELESLATDTHKFESRYLDNLVGPYPGAKDVYFARSPINFTHNLACPIIFFQGLEDRVVPPNQAEMMVKALREKKLPVAYLTYEGEQHGFRRAENIKRTIEAEFFFYSKIFNFQPADQIEPIQIENLN